MDEFQIQFPFYLTLWLSDIVESLKGVEDCLVSKRKYETEMQKSSEKLIEVEFLNRVKGLQQWSISRTTTVTIH